MDKVVLSPSKTSNSRVSPAEKTLKLLHERLDLAENEAKKLSEHLSSYGFNATAENALEGHERRSVIQTIAPFEVDKYDAGKYEILKNSYQELVARVCRTEGTVHSLKLALVSLEAEKTLMNRDSVAGTLSANEIYEKELKKLKKDLVNARKTLDESEKFRAQTEEDFQKLRGLLNIKSGSNVNVVKKVQEIKGTRDKLTKEVNELREELSHEKNVCKNFEDSHEDLLGRVAEMEKLVERENHEMKLLSGDCTRLKKELNETRSHCDREYQTRMQLEGLVERFRHDTEEMEEKLLNISNERKILDSNLVKIKRENKELKQQLEFLKKSSETLKEVNLDLEKRYKDINEALHLTENDNKILVAKHRESVEQERRTFSEKLKEQDKLLDEAKESILQELRKEKQKILKNEQEIAKLKEEKNSQQKLLKEKDLELLNVKDILQKVTVDREKMIQENDKVLSEIKRDLDQFVSEKISLVAELDDRKLEHETLYEHNKKLEEECEILQKRLIELEQQQTSHERINNALQNMVEDKRKLAYEKGILQSENEKLKSNAKAVEKQIRESDVNLKEYKQKLRNAEFEVRKLKGFASNKEKETELLLREKKEAMKTTEEMLRETDQNERQYSKQIDSLKEALFQSKEDNKKLAGTLDAIITSHTQLQSSCEALQTELGKRDSHMKYLEKERSETETKIVDLNNEVESLKSKLTQQNEAECKEVNIVRKTLDLLEQDREKLLNTVEPLMKANKDLQESLEGVANELKQKNDEIKKLRASSVNVKREMEIEAVAMETKVDDVRKEFDREMKDVKKNHKKEVAKLRKEFQEMLKLKNYLKEENLALKTEQEEAECRHKKLREKFKQTKNELDESLKFQAEQQNELEGARDKINAMSRELEILEKLKMEYTQNNMEQARSLQDFISQLTELQEEFKTLAGAQQESSLLCRQKDEQIKNEKLRRRTAELQCNKLKHRQKHLKVKQDVTERQLEEADYESQQVAVNLQEAHEWFKNKFTNLQSELNKSRKIQSILQKDNVDQYRALHEERRRAEDATEKAKEVIKSSRMMISKLVGQVTATSYGENPNDLDRTKH